MRVVTESAWCCHSVQAEASGKCVRTAWRMHGHSALPSMLTRSRSAATSGSSVPWAARGPVVPPPVAKALAGAGQADDPLVHAQAL